MRHPPRFSGETTVIRRGAAGFGLALGAVIVLGLVLAAATPAPAVDPPNFVVVVTDDQRWDSIGRCAPTFDPNDLAAGADSCMPNLQQDLIAAGTTFLKGEVTQALCCPSRASILSGQYPAHTGVTTLTGSDFDDSSSLATWLDDAGYRTGLFGKYLNGYGSGVLANYIPPGWDSFHSFHGYRNQDDPYHDYPWIDWTEGDPDPVVTRHSAINSTSEDACVAGNLYSTDLICHQSLGFLTAGSTDPFFLYVAPISPHDPTLPASRHTGIYAGLGLTTYPDHNVIPSPNPPSYLPSQPMKPNTLNRLIGIRRRALETNRATDDLIGALHDQLAADGRLANTVWVFISDNGIAAGEHRLSGKQCSYLACHRVPFVVVCPPTVCAGATPGAVDASNYALNIDIAPTLAELAGVTPTLRVDGRSLLPILQTPTADWPTDWVLYDNVVETDGIVAEATDGDTYKYLKLRATGEIELYNLTDDEWELVNLWGNPAYASVEAEMAAALADSTSNPALTITSAPPPSTGETSATIAYSSDEPVTFECRLDGGAVSICGTGMSGSVTYEGLSVATHAVAVEAVDRYNNVSAVATVTFTVTGPGSTPPPPTLTQTPPDPSGPDVTFAFTDSEPAVTFECTLDAATAPCTSPTGYTGLTDGPHTFSVVAINDTGPSSPATYNWASEATQPTLTVTITKPLPDALTTATSVKLAWTGSAGITTYQVYERFGIEGTPTLVATQTKTTLNRTLAAPGTYCFQVHGFDSGGAFGVSDLVCQSLAEDDRAAVVVYSGSVAQTSVTGAYKGTLTVLDGAGEQGQFGFVGRQAGLVAQVGPDSGIAEIWVDGVPVATVDLYAKSTRNARFVWSDTMAYGSHTVTVVWTGTKNTRSSGTGVSVDGVAWTG